MLCSFQFMNVFRKRGKNGVTDCDRDHDDYDSEVDD